MAEKPEKTFIRIILNRASLGDAEFVFARIQGTSETPCHIAWIPRQNIIIDEQPLNGDEITAKLSVDIIRRQSDGNILINTKDRGNDVQWIINNQGQILPKSSTPVFD
jgi:hypothetical protein